MIDKFDDEYFFLSNFYPTKITYKGITYRNSESAYQAQKCPGRASQFQNLSGKEAKELGKQVILRDDWEKIKYSEMANIVYYKFLQNPELAKKLKDTGNEVLVEGSTSDRYWGKVKGIGMNKLGEIVMQVRESI